MADLYVSWSEYHQKIEHLAVEIYQSSWEFDQIVCLAKGGLRVGDILARVYNRPLAILATSSYGGSDNRERGSIIFSRDLTMTTANLGTRVLLVDDLVDSGVTLQRTLSWLDHHYGSYVKEVKTAVLWYKACSAIVPDFFVDYLVESPWIHQPFETYEKMSPAELAATYLSPTAPDLDYSASSDLRLV